jgi:hypothetical protein
VTALADTAQAEGYGETSLQGKPRQVRHISDEDIAALVDETLSARRCKQIVVHLANCVQCRKVVSETAMSQTVITDPDNSSS